MCFSKNFSKKLLKIEILFFENFPNFILQKCVIQNYKNLLKLTELFILF